MNKIIMKTVVLSRFLCYLPSSVIATSVKRLNSIYMLLALLIPTLSNRHDVICICQNQKIAVVCHVKIC